MRVRVHIIVFLQHVGVSKSGDGDDITIYEDIEELQELVDKQLKQTHATISQMGKSKDCMFPYPLHSSSTMCVYLQIIGQENQERNERRKTWQLTTLKHLVAALSPFLYETSLQQNRSVVVPLSPRLLR